jgi:Na+-driven multidrug efflux pump
MIDRTKIPLLQLALPLWIENIIRTSLLAVDQFMLYRFSEKAVAAMSVVNQLSFFIQLLYMMIAIGASIHISQNLGAHKKWKASLIGLASFELMAVFSLVISLLFLFFSNSLAGLFGLEPLVQHYAFQFLTIYGGASIFMALNILQANILRSYGYARDPMVVNIIALLITIAGNYLSLFGPFGLPVFGVVGVAVSTVTSQVVAFFILAVRIRHRKEIALPFKKLFAIPRRIYSCPTILGNC